MGLIRVFFLSMINSCPFTLIVKDQYIHIMPLGLLGAHMLMLVYCIIIGLPPLTQPLLLLEAGNDTAAILYGSL